MEPDEFRQMMKARRNVYDLLRCFFLQEPAEGFLQALKEEDFFESLRGYDPELDEGIDLVTKVLSSPGMSLGVPELVQEYTRLFIGPRPVPLSESVYRSASGLIMQEETLAVRHKYQESGLVIHPEQPFPDDHIGAELEFIFYLCQKATQAEEPEQKDILLKKQQDFFREHLILWISPLCDRLLEETRSAYFKGVAKITKGFIRWDYEKIDSQFF